MSAERPTAVTVTDERGAIIWACGGVDGPGFTSMAYLEDGTQERIIETLLGALVEARGQLRRPLQVTNVVPYVRAAAAEVNDSIPMT